MNDSASNSAPVDNSTPEDLVEIGRVLAAYGVKGWVKIQPYSSDAAALLAARQWWLKAPVPPGKSGAFSRAQLTRVVSAKRHASSVVAQLSIIPDRDRAEAFKGYSIWAPRASFPKADPDEFYWVDLVGCRVMGVDDDGAPALIGQVTEVSDNGAHGLLHVARAVDDGQGGLTLLLDDKGRKKDVLVPFVEAHVPVVDLPNKRIESNWPVSL
ncbi:MAG: ribosome maturation factor RimM [Pusillimonas sp.]